MSILSNYIIQDLIQNVSKGVTETFKFVLERYNSNEVFAYTLSVSYTHLDVYKRQIRNCLPTLPIAKPVLRP